MTKNKKIITGIISLFLVATPIFTLRALAVTDTTPPSQPNGLTAALNVGNQVILSWNPATDNTGVAGYIVTRNNNIITNTTATNYLDVNVLASTNYSYSVLAYDAAGNVSQFSSSVSINTATSSDTTLPSAPSDLLATTVSPSRINLSWSVASDNVGVTGYNIYRNNALVATSSINSFANIGLSASTSYTFYVKAYDAAGNISAQSNVATATTLAIPSHRDDDEDEDEDVNCHEDNGKHLGQLKEHANNGKHLGQLKLRLNAHIGRDHGHKNK
jgi:chitodextrinase